MRPCRRSAGAASTSTTNAATWSPSCSSSWRTPDSLSPIPTASPSTGGSSISLQNQPLTSGHTCAADAGTPGGHAWSSPVRRARSGSISSPGAGYVNSRHPIPPGDQTMHLSPEEFAEGFGSSFDHEAYRLELLDAYVAPNEAGPLRRYLAGEMP